MTPIIASVLAGLIVTAGLAVQEQKRQAKQRVPVRIRRNSDSQR